jgi:hypothetical protein
MRHWLLSLVGLCLAALQARPAQDAAPTPHRPGVSKGIFDDKDGLTAALGSPHLAVQALAVAKLHAHGLPKALEVLQPAALQKGNFVLRARALWQLGRLGSLRFVVGAFTDPDPCFRILAMRVFAEAQGITPADYIPDWREHLLKDPCPAVRREALLLLSEVPAPKARCLILELARLYDGKDPSYREAIVAAVGQNGARRAALLNDFEKESPPWAEEVAALLRRLRLPPPR